MDVSFSNVLEGTRQYFMGLPKPAGDGQPAWPPGVGAPPEEGAPAQSGAPTPTSRPPSAAAGPAAPQRPPSEPLEPEPHIIHKATVMREAAEKRREQPDVDEEVHALSPPPHVIRRPLPSPAPAPAAPSPSPARPPSATAPPPAPEVAPSDAQYRSGPQTQSARPPDPYAPARPPDPYSASRPPEPYARYHYEGTQPAPPPRHSPHTYARLSSAQPAHSSRLPEGAAHSPAVARPYAVPAPPPANDRVPPIHHPPQRVAHPLPPTRHEASYSRSSAHYDRHPTLPQRKYDHQQAYPGYRPAPAGPQPLPAARVEPHPHPHAPYKAAESTSRGYPTRPYHETRPPPLDAMRRDYPPIARPVKTARSSYMYPTPSTSARYGPTAATAPPAPLVQSSTAPARPAPPSRPAAAPKSNYELPTTNHVQTSPSRSTSKPGYPNQARMTVSVTSLVNQMNQTKQKRESPLDLSVKTVKNSADSSTTQDDVVDSATSDKHLPIPPMPTSSTRPAPGPGPAPYVESHKVDFAPNFTQYRERITSASHSYAAAPQPGHLPVRYNGGYEPPRPVPEVPYHAEPRHTYPEHCKYPTPPTARPENVPRIDLTRPVRDERRPENRIRDDRHFIIEERKRPSGPIVSNIPEKMVRYETWAADSRIDRMTQSAIEQHELMSRPVYSYSSHKQFEAYQNEQKRATATSTAYRDHYPPHQNHRYPPYPEPPMARDLGEPHGNYHDRVPSMSNRHVIQKIPNHREAIPHPHHHLDHHSGVPADKRVLSILRNSLETKHTGLEPARPTRPMPDVIVLDDVDDPVIEITDDADTSNKNFSKRFGYSKLTDNLGEHIKMPKAVDSLPHDSEYQRHESVVDPKSSPENDIARIRTKGELKGLPPSDCSLRHDSQPEKDQYKPLPKSMKQHLFNQMRQDNLRFESVIKSEKSDTLITAVKPEPMNIDEIEKDAVIPIKTENLFESLQPDSQETCSLPEEDDDWASACDSFMEQLKTTRVPKKKGHRRRTETMERENEGTRVPKTEHSESIEEKETQEIKEPAENSTNEIQPVVIKQEPIDEEEIKNTSQNITIGETDNFDKKTEELVSDLKLTEENKNEGSEKAAKKVNVDSDKDTITPNKDKVTPKKKITPKSSPNKDKMKFKRRSLDKDDLPIKEKHSQDENKVKVKRCLLDKDSPIKGKNTDKNKKNMKMPRDEKSNKGDMKEKNIIKNKNELEERQKTEEINLNKSRKEKEISEKCNTSDKNITSKEKEIPTKARNKIDARHDTEKSSRKKDNEVKNSLRDKIKAKSKREKTISSTTPKIKKEIGDDEPLKTLIKEEPESTDDDEPLINSKILKEKEIKFQLLKDLSEKSAYVKLECFDVDMNKNTRISIDSLTKDKEATPISKKTTRRVSRLKGKAQSLENCKDDTQNDDTSTSDDEDLTVASRLRVRKITKTEDNKPTPLKTPVKSSPKKQQEIASSSSTPVRKSGFGDGSDFHPGWEEELYRYKRSIRMPARLIAVPRGRSGGPFGKVGALFNRGSTSLPDLDPTPLSPAPSLASAATDDLCARRQDKLNPDSDGESTSSCSLLTRLHYDSEASTSTVFSSSTKKKKVNSIVDVLMQKCGKKDDGKRKGKDKEKDEIAPPKIIPKSTNPNELLPTPSLGLVKNGNKGILSAKKEKLMEDIFYLGAFRKETVSAFRNAFISNTDGLIGATEEFAPVVLKSRTRTESKVLKHRATIKEVFGDERPASAPPTSCRSDDEKQEEENEDDKPIVKIKQEKEAEPEAKPKMKPKKIVKDKLLRRSSTIRDGLRSTKSLKRNDAKGRLMRLKKRNSLMTHVSKRIKEFPANKIKKEKTDETTEDKTSQPKEGTSLTGEGTTKRRLKRLFGRRKFSSGFDYIRKKKKIVRRDESSTPNNKIRRPAVKPSPESVHDIQKEIKGWIINKSVGETNLHRAARLGYTDCVAYCLEKLSADASAKDNAGYTPLHVAAQKGHVRIARLLLQYGANVSAAAQGGIRPLHEASENCHVEVMRLLLSYGADPLLGTYSGQTPEELTEGPAARFLRLYIADVQGRTIEPWRFPHPAEIIDREELGCDPLSSPPPGSPPPPPDATIEMQCTETPLPPFYLLRSANGQPADGLWCLLQDVTTILQIKSKDSLLKQIHCGSGSPKELLREIKTQDFLERAQCHQLLCAGEKVNVRASKVSLVRVTDKLRQLLKIETVLVS